jgi:hypothetical protein
MSRRLVRILRLTAAVALAAALLVPAAAAAPDRDRGAAWPWTFFRTLWTAVWGAGGPGIDPNGATAPPPETDGGPEIDPDG